MRRDVAIVGVGETTYSRADPRSKSVLAAEAINRALDDAGIAAAEVDGYITTSDQDLHCGPDEMSLAIGGMRTSFSIRGSAMGGAVLVDAPRIARSAINGGLASVIVVYFALKLSSMAGGPAAGHAGDPIKTSLEMPFGYYGQAVYFAAVAKRYEHEFGSLPEALGSIAVTTREHAVRTPGAMKREPLSMDDYFHDPVVAEPLHKLDCCLINDGAVAYVITSLERARDLDRPPVVFAGGGFASKHATFTDYFTQSDDLLCTAAVDSAAAAYRDADVTPKDIDVVEIYDCFTISMLLQLEDMGFAAKGMGREFVRTGATGPGGILPVNTHGGLLSHSYMLGGSHMVEAVRQLRGERGQAQVENATIAAVAGLSVPDHATAILTVDR